MANSGLAVFLAVGAERLNQQQFPTRQAGMLTVEIA